MTPPRVIGEGNHRTLEGVGRSIFVACLANARLRGRSAFIETGDVALLDFEGEELTRLDDRLALDPAVFCIVDDRELWMIEPKRETAQSRLTRPSRYSDSIPTPSDIGFGSTYLSISSHPCRMCCRLSRF